MVRAKRDWLALAIMLIRGLLILAALYTLNWAVNNGDIVYVLLGLFGLYGVSK